MPPNKTVAITITANTRRLKADMRRATQEVRAFERQVGGVANRMKRMRMNIQGMGIFGRGGGAIRTAAGFAGVFGFQQLIADAKNMDAALTDVAITGNLTGAKLSQLKKQMFEVSNATGKSTTEVLSFVSAMTTATGDTGAAMIALKGIGEVAVATGTDMGALGQVFVKLTTSMKILPREAKQAFNVLRSQEKMGSVTMADMARVMPEIVGAAGILGPSATGMGGLAALGGLTQITRRGTGTVDDAKTASMRFMQKLFINRKKIKKNLGIDVEKELAKNDLGALFGLVGQRLAKDGNLGKYGVQYFGARGIKTATQLRDAAAAGLGNKIGSLQSFNAIMGAGKTDEIGIDYKKRMASKSQGFTVVLNKLKNTLQKFALPVFGKLADVLKEFGPDMVKMLKFMLENSKNLLKLWLGYKGATFFRNLIKAGGMGAQPGTAMGGGFAAGGGMISATSVRGGHISGMNPGMISFRDSYQGSDLQMLRNENRGGRISRRFGNFGRSGRMGRAAQWSLRNQGRGRGALGGAGMGLGMASSFYGSPGQEQFKGQDMAENIALQTNNPYAIAAALAMKGSRTGQNVGRAQGGWSGGALQALTGSAFSTYKGLGNLGQKNDSTVGLSVDAVTRDLLKLSRSLETASLRVDAKVGRWRTGTIEGVKHTERRTALLTELGMGGAGGGFVMNEGVVGRRGSKSMLALRSRLQASNSVEKRIAMQGLKPGQEATEENLRKANPQYALTAGLLKELNQTMVEVRNGVWKKSNINIVIGKDGIGRRLDMVTDWGSGNDGHPTGRGGSRDTQ